jgi:CMP-N-acetylneuraminic acid synthetase
MYKQHKIIGIIPARGQSDEVDHLNTKEIGGKPMISYAIERASKSSFLDRLLVSTEDTRTAEIARKAGAWVPFTRPKELSLPGATLYDVARHALSNIDMGYEIVVTLQPNVPFRTADDVDRSIAMLVEGTHHSVISVVEERDFFWIGEEKTFRPFTHANGAIHRKDCLPLYRMVGGIETAWARNYETKQYLGNRIGLFVMDEHHAKTVNSLYDLLVVERLIKLPISLITGLKNGE